MIINLDYQSRLPIYVQIVNEIERYVMLGILKPHDQIPAIRELASTLGVNPNTVKRAYKEMEEKGLITTFSTKGTFISDNISFLTDKKIKDLFDGIKNNIRELQKLGLEDNNIKDEILKNFSK